MIPYNHKTIEQKWRERWEKENPGAAKEVAGKEKSYLLVEFPYPSGAGLHVGHVRSYTAMDVIARKRRREGKNVLYPIGWDAFGLPTENYAIKTGRDPREVTKENTDTFRRQLKSLGLSFDWLREINTTDPSYYKWTQWIFLELFKKGLAYKAKTQINWCPKCKIGLANEEVVDGACERCGNAVEKREKEQWMLKITEYAKRLYDDLDTVDYIERAKVQQRNWIGPSEGAEIAFEIKNIKEKIEIFTTRPDTLFGATYLVLAPEHSVLENLKSKIENWDEVEAYRQKTKQKTDIERAAEGKEKTGVEIKGVKAVNPATKEEIPIWIADYVLGSYGTGAIMAVPAHDERDWEFAKKFDLTVRHVVRFTSVDLKNPPHEGKEDVFRRIVHVVVRNKKGETLLLKWKGKAWDEAKRWPVTFLIGGIEEGEDPVEAALREVREEAGFTKLRHIQTLPVPARVRFYAAHKGVNRTADVYSVVFELEDETREAVSEEELEKHDAIFVPDSEVAKTLNIPDDLFFWKQITEPTAFAGEGMLTNSGNFDGLTSAEAKTKITEHVGGKMVTRYKLRDWVFSRQRYWGEPIPLVFCEKDGWVPVPEEALPVELPKVKKYEPTDTGESPLANIDEWVETSCPTCGGAARRETDVMPNWAGSSWYYLRYCDPTNATALASKDALAYWTPVDWYNGGMEHTTLHLLYSRFWHKFLYDIGAVPTPEPYQKRTSHGLILAEDGEKMSKSKGNVVNPDDIIDRVGADALRVYEMFMGPFDQAIAWNTDGLVGARRFLERVERLKEKVNDQQAQHDTGEINILMHKTIKKIGEDIEQLKMNTAISQLMILTNALEKLPAVSLRQYQTLILLLAPFAPFLGEELWAETGGAGSVHEAAWPTYDEALLTQEEVTIAVQVNGKVRGVIIEMPNATEQELADAAKTLPAVARAIGERPIKKTIFISGKIINFIITP